MDDKVRALEVAIPQLCAVWGMSPVTFAAGRSQESDGRWRTLVLGSVVFLGKRLGLRNCDLCGSSRAACTQIPALQWVHWQSAVAALKVYEEFVQGGSIMGRTLASEVERIWNGLPRDRGDLVCAPLPFLESFS